MAEYDLPDGPRQLFERVRWPLARAFGGERHIRFGGGTALAARWAHRHSVDVDLFAEPEPYLHFQRITGARFVLDLTGTSGASSRRIAIDRDETYISFSGLDGHITVNPGRLTDQPRSLDTVRGTNVPFETTNEILGKKLAFRMARRQTILSQDLYDIAWANRHDPGELALALRELTRAELADIIHAFERSAASGRKLKPLLDPADPTLEKHAPGIVEQLVRDLHSRGRDSGRDRGPEFTR